MSSFGLTDDEPVTIGFGLTVRLSVAVPLQPLVVPTTVNVWVPEEAGVNVEPVISSPFPSVQT